MDMAVFCLALMGTDYPAFLEEARRVLKPSGMLWIAEVRSRFSAGPGKVRILSLSDCGRGSKVKGARHAFIMIICRNFCDA